MEKKTCSKNQNESPKPCPRATGSGSKESSGDKISSKSNATNIKHQPPHSGIKFVMDRKKTTVVKPFSFDRKKEEPATNIKHQPPHSGIKFVMDRKKTTVVKPFSFDRKKKEPGTPSSSTEKVEKDAVSEPKDAEGKVQVVMDTLKISRSEEYCSEESSSSKTEVQESPVHDSECCKKEHGRCSRATKVLTNLFVEKPVRGKSQSRERSPVAAKKESENLMKKECTRCKRNSPDPLKSMKPDLKPSKDETPLEENSARSSVKKECSRCLRTAKPQTSTPRNQNTDVKTRAKSPADAAKSDEPTPQPTKAIKTKPSCSKIAKLQATKSEVKTSKASQAKASTEVQVEEVDSTVTEITQNEYMSKESVMVSSQTSNTESFCVIEESDLKSSLLKAFEEKEVLLNGSESGIFHITEDEYELLNGANIVSEIMEEAKYEAESFVQKSVQETLKSTSKIPRKTQGGTPNVKMNGNPVKETIAEQHSFENRCPNSLNQPANHEESLLVN